jgi:hypothetical protein
MARISTTLLLSGLCACNGPLYDHGPTQLHIASHVDDAWQEQQRVEVRYSDTGRMQSYTILRAIDSNWLPVSRALFEVDGSGRLIGFAEQEADGDTWMAVKRTRLSYSDSGVKTQRSEVFTEGQWITRSIKTFSIEKGRTARLDTQSMGGEGDVQHTRRDEFHYEGDHLVAQVGFVQIENEWVSQDRVDLTYGSDHLLAEVTRAVNVGSDQPLRLTDRLTYTHTGAERIATVERATPEGDNWSTETRKRFEYDEQDQVTAMFEERSVGGVWKSRTRTRLQYGGGAANSELGERIPQSADWTNTWMENIYGHAMPYRSTP